MKLAHSDCGCCVSIGTCRAFVQGQPPVLSEDTKQAIDAHSVGLKTCAASQSEEGFSSYNFPHIVEAAAKRGCHKLLTILEHRMGVEPMNTGFADQRVSHFATGARVRHTFTTV